ncbi:hypothetical protein TPA0906_13780 [Streptomyces olivaceus]|nr:hypothetical protein TPA0906_13780 [Streptomyces olivaceus]
MVRLVGPNLVGVSPTGAAARTDSRDPEDGRAKRLDVVDVRNLDAATLGIANTRTMMATAR